MSIDDGHVWCHPTISSSVIPFASHLQSFPASGSFPVCQLFSSGGQRAGVSASASVLPMTTQDRFPLGWTGWISLQSKGLSRVFSNTTVQKHQFFGAQLSLEKAMAPHSSTLAWKIPWTEEADRLQFMGSWRVGNNWVTSLSLFTFMHWRRKWQPTPVFLPGETQGQGSRWAAVYGVAQSWIRLKWLSRVVTAVKAMIFPVVMYRCDSWTLKKAEYTRICAFELWWWRGLLTVPWTARRSKQSIPKEINPEYSLEGLMLKLKLQYFGHLM